MSMTRGVVGEGRAVQYAQASQPLARMILGARLRRLREEAGVTPEDAGQAIRASRSKISRLELGRIGCKGRDVADLLTLYGITASADRATILALAEHATAGSWWHDYADVVPAWLEQYLDLEQVACLIRAYEVQYVPGLLQTEEYARAVLRAGHPGAPEKDVELRVELRLQRQQALYRDNPVRMWSVIDETALRRPIGGLAVMRAQIEQLIELSRLPHVNIQVLPLSAGGHPAFGGRISVLRFSESELPDVVYLEQMLSAIYLARPADTAYYRDILNRLAVHAEPPDMAAATLERMLHATGALRSLPLPRARIAP